ncbi:MAG: hypothetical protein A2W98_12510 [Bacteroidetes bacterium GWF2_33_38]|nr:MAG: hypothetical protein A2W98_12510 [Bacteroidetes bacterium GWF2_33_38]OFY72726.1 MAG: hypothetical protein A2265_03610 [Bacteroidetes bacterium RIFOXYA12_FULL_33_9]
MKKLLFVFAAILTIPTFLFSQEEKKEEYGIKWGGFIANDMLYNTRQVVSARGEGLLLLVPSPLLLDADGEDINATPNLNLIGIHSRLKGTITSPDAFGAKTSGYLEIDFYGKDAATAFMPILRHAFMKMNWEGGSELLIGQFWNPSFVTDCYPGTVSYGAGVPFNPLSRTPQLRFTRAFGGLKVFASIMSQGAVKSSAGATTAMNSGIPEAHIQIQYAKKKEDGTGIFTGAGFYIKTLKPLNNVTADTNGVALKYKTDVTVSGATSFAYFKMILKPITFKLYGMLGQLNDNMVMMGGYATQYDTTTVLSTGNRYDYTYSPYKTLTTWVDFNTNGKKIEVGLFAGYSKNLGTLDDITINAKVGRWTDVESMMRIAPRVVFKSSKMSFGFELEYSSVNYGSVFGAKGVVEEFTTANNIRGIFSAMYNF